MSFHETTSPLAGPSSCGASATQTKITRTRTGCLVCRKRRVKCDLGKPTCTRCTKYGADCTYPAKVVLIPRRNIAPLPLVHLASLCPTTDSTSRTARIDDNVVQSTERLDPAVPLSPQGQAQRYGWPASLSALDATERILAICKNTRIGQFFTAPLLPPEFLRVVFPQDEELRCFHHCITYTLSIIVVKEESNPWILHVVPLFMVENARPMSCSALKAALLYLGAVHLSYLYGRDGNLQAGSKTRTLAIKYRNESCAALRTAVFTMEDVKDPAYLAACCLLLTADLLAANPKWREIMRLTRRGIAKIGGCRATLFPGGRTIPHPAMKCVMDLLVFVGATSTLSSNESHGILGARDLGDEDESWWTDLGFVESYSAETRPFEHNIGISRELFLLISRTIKHLHPPGTIYSTPFVELDVLAHDISTTILLPNMDQSMKFRIEAGSSAWLYAIQILLETQIRPPSPTEGTVNEVGLIRSGALGILEICESMGDKIELMNWPMIIACSTFHSAEDRNRARECLKSFAVQCCYEIEVVQMVCEEMWLRMDGGENVGFMPWVEILVDSGCSVLLG